MDHPRTRRELAERAQAERRRRQGIAERLAADHDGLVTRPMLLKVGLSPGQVRGEIERGAWHAVGWRTISVVGPALAGPALWRRALWESGERAALDGASALPASGLKGWTEAVIDVSVPNSARVPGIDGVRHHWVRSLGPVVTVGLRRTRPEVAAIRAAQWAVSPRQGATLIAMTIQQRLTTPEKLLERWAGVRH